MPYIDTVLELRDLGDMDEVLRVLERKPLVLLVEKTLFDAVEQILRKSLVIYSVLGLEEGGRVRVLLTYPEHFLTLHRDIEEKSFTLADPEYLYDITFFLRKSELLESRRVSTPLDLVKLLHGSCRHGYRFIYLVSTSVPARAYVLCVSSVIHAVVYQDSLTHTGLRALRLLFYTGPYEVNVYRLRESDLRT